MPYRLSPIHFYHCRPITLIKGEQRRIVIGYASRRRGYADRWCDGIISNARRCRGTVVGSISCCYCNVVSPINQPGYRTAPGRRRRIGNGPAVAVVFTATVTVAPASIVPCVIVRLLTLVGVVTGLMATDGATVSTVKETSAKPIRLQHPWTRPAQYANHRIAYPDYRRRPC